MALIYTLFKVVGKQLAYEQTNKENKL